MTTRLTDTVCLGTRNRLQILRNAINVTETIVSEEARATLLFMVDDIAGMLDMQLWGPELEGVAREHYESLEETEYGEPDDEDYSWADLKVDVECWELGRLYAVTEDGGGQ